MNESQILLRKYLDSGLKASKWLERSQKRWASHHLTTPPEEEVFDGYENLANRFARLSDILIQKIFRLVDQMMLESQGSFIDVILRAEMRGLGDARQMRSMGELRLALDGEYVEEDLIALFVEAQKNTSELLAIFRRTEAFIDAHRLLEEG